MSKKSPDSITDWVFNAYCLSPQSSIGIAPSSTLKVFQPFFVSINLPYSVIKGEILPVQVSVFNYMKQCTPVSLQLRYIQIFVTNVCSFVDFNSI